MHVYIALHCIALHFIILHYMHALHCIALSYITLHYIHYVAFYCIAVKCRASQRIAFHHITSHHMTWHDIYTQIYVYIHIYIYVHTFFHTWILCTSIYTYWLDIYCVDCCFFHLHLSEKSWGIHQFRFCRTRFNVCTLRVAICCHSTGIATPERITYL